MTEIQSIFARNMRKYRKAANLSQEKLAELANLHRTYIGGIEQQRVNVSLNNIEKIATALKIDPAILFLSESPPKDGRAPRDEASAVAGEPYRAAYGDAKKKFALICLEDDQVVVHPIEAPFKDLTVQVLCALTLNGYSGEQLAKRYSEAIDEIMAFLKLCPPIAETAEQ